MTTLDNLPPFQTLTAGSPDAKEMLGPLYDFIGTWSNDPHQGWNLIAVPGPVANDAPITFFNSNHGFYLETIPYIETTTFTPIAVTLNRGGFVESKTQEQIQQIGAILYEQTIVSAGADTSNPHHQEIDKFFAARGFSEGTPIHAERGMLLNITNYQGNGSGDLQIARMGTIPHGNAVLCLGSAVPGTSPDINPDGTSVSPTVVNPKDSLPLDYDISTYSPPDHNIKNYPFYPYFTPLSPNQTLVDANQGVTFLGTTHISLSTENASGGILNIPFVDHEPTQQGIGTTKMTVDYWVSKIQSGSEELSRIQYVQNINLVFPATGDPDLPINWPHIGLNTLHKVTT